MTARLLAAPPPARSAVPRERAGDDAPAMPPAALRDLRVAFVAGTLGQGGAERQLVYVLEALVAAGARPRLLVLTRDEYWESHIRALGVPVTRVGGGGGRSARLRRIVAALRRDPVDVVQSQHFYTNLYVAAAARLLGVPGIGALRNDAKNEVRANGRILGRASLLVPTLVAANSLRGIENAVALGAQRDRLHLLPNVVDVARFVGEAPPPACADGTVHLVAIGRLEPQKRHDRFVRLVHALRTRHGIAARGTIVGDGSLRPELEAQARTLGLGPGTLDLVGRSETPAAWYAAADLVLLTSDWEGTPNVVLEGMASGRCVVATDVGGVRALVDHGRTGFVVDREDDAALLETVRTLVHDPARRAQVGDVARATIEETHGVRALARHLVTLYARAGVIQPDPDAAPRPAPVMHLTDTLDVGGSERMAVLLANAAAREGASIHLCATWRDGRLEGLVAPGVARLRLGRRRRVDLRALLRLVGYVRHHHVRVLHAHGTSVFIAVAVALLARGVRVVWHVHHGRYASRGDRGLAYRLVRPRVARVLSASEPLARWVVDRIGIPAARVTYVPNCAVLARASSTPPPLPGARALRVVHVGTLQPDKDHLTLVRAFARVVDAVPGAHLFLVGRTSDAGYATSVRRTVAELGIDSAVSFLGERIDIDTLLGQMHVGVISSRAEGLPLALLEYGAAQLGVASTDAGQCGAVLGHGARGLVVPRGDAVALADALVRLLRDRTLRDTLAARLHDAVVTEYTIESAYRLVRACHAAVS